MSEQWRLYKDPPDSLVVQIVAILAGILGVGCALVVNDKLGRVGDVAVGIAAAFGVYSGRSGDPITGLLYLCAFGEWPFIALSAAFGFDAAMAALVRRDRLSVARYRTVSSALTPLIAVVVGLSTASLIFFWWGEQVYLGVAGGVVAIGAVVIGVVIMRLPATSSHSGPRRE